MAYSGTVVTYGQGTGVVVATGMATEIGRISSMLSDVESLTTPLLRRMADFGRWLTVVILALAFVVFWIGTWVWNFPASEMFMAAVALAVGAIPEGLPAIITITLAIGVERMSRRKAIIRRLPAVETLGAVTTSVRKDRHIDQERDDCPHRSHGGSTLRNVRGRLRASRRFPRERRQMWRPMVRRILIELCGPPLLCSDARYQRKRGRWVIEGDPMEGASSRPRSRPAMISRSRKPRNVRARTRYPSIPAPLHGHAAPRSLRNGFIYVKGAPERLLAMCVRQRTRWPGRHSIRPIIGTADRRHRREGQRVLAVAAKRPNQASARSVRRVERRPRVPRPSGPDRSAAREPSPRWRNACRAGIRVKMITGDHAATARAIARQVGLENTGEVLTGADLDRLDARTLELGTAVLNTTVFARTSPEHKLRLVKVPAEPWSDRGHDGRRGQ